MIYSSSTKALPIIAVRVAYPRPRNLIRDGVGSELLQIRSACQATYDLSNKALPRIIVITAVKQHNTRVYPTDRHCMDLRPERSKNGTLRDSGITMRHIITFCSIVNIYQWPVSEPGT